MHCGSHHHRGAAALGLAAAAVASAVARPARGRMRRLPRQEVVILNSAGGVPAYATPVSGVPVQGMAAPVYAQPGTVVAPYAMPPQRRRGHGPGMVVIQQGPAEQQRPLGVAAVRVPAEVIEQRDNVQFFGIDVTSEDGGVRWRVMRRYNDFHALCNTLGRVSRNFPGAPFPKKLLFGCTGHRLEERRSALELWLRRAIESPHSANAWLRPLRDFLEAGRQSLGPAQAAPLPPPPVAPTSSALPQAPAAAPPLPPPLKTPIGSELPQAPAPPPPSITQLAEDEAEYFEIQVPPGVAPGQLLGVALPDGRQLALPLPEGLSPGSSLELRYDAASGTLSVAK